MKLMILIFNNISVHFNNSSGIFKEIESILLFKKKNITELIIYSLNTSYFLIGKFLKNIIEIKNLFLDLRNFNQINMFVENGNI